MKYDRDGPSKRCVSGVIDKVAKKLSPCDVASDDECVGRQFTNYIYKVKNSEPNSEPNSEASFEKDTEENTESNSEVLPMWHDEIMS